MIKMNEEEYLLTHAYVPEHIVGLMTQVSGGEPFLIQDYFCCRKKDRLIVVGYPLGKPFKTAEFEALIDRVKRDFYSEEISIIAPEIPECLMATCQERDSDFYYTLELGNIQLQSNLKRMLKKAARNLTVERADHLQEAHQELIQEFVRRVKPDRRVVKLLQKMPDYVSQTEKAVCLNAWDKKKHLGAFYIVDLAAKDFAAYVIGAYSKNHYVVGASDLLCFEMIQLSREKGKTYIHLGLGVNKGIRRFKEKWGAVPTRPYEMCALMVRKPSMFREIMRAWRNKGFIRENKAPSGRT